jgi:hypothetical protein
MKALDNTKSLKKKDFVLRRAKSQVKKIVLKRDQRQEIQCYFQSLQWGYWKDGDFP